MLPVFSLDGQRVDTLDLKVLLLTQGLRVRPEVYEAFGSAHRISPDPRDCNVLFLPDGYNVCLCRDTWKRRIELLAMH